jgi:26S proteasome regulatory subunit N2
VCSESLYESDELPKDARDQAALLASKVYYYLSEYDDALSFALGAGNAFNDEVRTPGWEEYVETIVCMSYFFFVLFNCSLSLIFSQGN